MTTARVVLGYRGAQVLAFIRATVSETGRPPSYESIRDELGFNDRAEVCRCVQRIERRGFIRRVGGGRTRRIRLVQNNNCRGAE